MKKTTLYEITTDDIKIILGIDREFSTQDLNFISDKIGEFLGDQWHAAVKYALEELERDK